MQKAVARLTAFVTFAGLAVSAWAIPPLPRKSPEFTILLPDGKQQLLSTYRGKVVVLAFMATWCPHCQEFSQVLTKIQKEMGPRGLQALGVAFNQPVTPEMVNEFVQKFNVGFPVGYSSAVDPVLSYLGISLLDRYVYPQIVVIDRKGMIRYQTPVEGGGSPSLQAEGYLRTVVEELLKEAGATKQAPAAAKKGE